MSASPELAALVDRAERLQRELAAVSDALLFLQEREVLALRHTAFINDRTRAQIVVERLFVTPALWRDLRAGGAAPWAAALAALETDAAAPLPAA
jgi:hypothetical protein